MSLLAVKTTSFEGNCIRIKRDERRESSEESATGRTNSAAVKSPTCPLNAVSFPFPSLLPFAFAPASNRTTSTTLACPSRPATITLRSSPLRAKPSIPPRTGKRRSEGAGASCEAEFAEVEAEESALSEGAGRRTGVGGMSSLGHATVKSLCRGLLSALDVTQSPQSGRLTHTRLNVDL